MSTETLITDGAPAPAAPAAPADGAAPNAPAAPVADTAAPGTDQNQPGTDAKTPEQLEADAAAKAAEEAAKAQGAPEKYEPFTAPDGTAMDTAFIAKFEETARALNLPQDKAQQLIDGMAPVMAQRHAEQMEQVRTEWAAQSTADKEFGGEKLQENLAFAKKAIDTFATPELKTILNETGLGNHPELVRFMYRAGKAISEDKIVTGGAPASTNRSPADILYGGSTKQ